MLALHLHRFPIRPAAARGVSRCEQRRRAWPDDVAMAGFEGVSGRESAHSSRWCVWLINHTLTDCRDCGGFRRLRAMVPLSNRDEHGGECDLVFHYLRCSFARRHRRQSSPSWSVDGVPPWHRWRSALVGCCADHGNGGGLCPGACGRRQTFIIRKQQTNDRRHEETRSSGGRNDR